MRRLLQLFVISVGLVALLSCSSFQTSDFSLMVRLPASRECFEVHPMTGVEKRYSAEKCDQIIERAIFMTSDSWKLLRGDIQTNCLNAQCTQISGAADGLFLAIDRALQNVPLP